jgi:hypothetical protein
MNRTLQSKNPDASSLPALPAAAEPIVQLEAATNINNRRFKRFRRDGILSVIPWSHGMLGEAFQAQLKDVSTRGIGIIHTVPLPIGSRFLIRHAYRKGEPKTLLYQVVRCNVLSAAGLFCIGAELTDVLRPSHRSTSSKWVPAQRPLKAT